MTALSGPMEIVELERSLDTNVPTQDTLGLMTSSSNKHTLQSFYPNELSAYQSSPLPTSLYNRSAETMGSNSNNLEQHSLYHQPVQRKSPLESVMEQQTQLTKDLSTNSVELSSDPQNLRFEYPLDEPSSVKSKPKKSTPTMYRDQDRFVPINNIGRTMRNAIPKSGKVSKDAKECMQECVSEYISFLTSEASDRCIDEKRKTITGDDILYALSTLGFDNYVEPLQQYLKKYRDFIRLDKTDKEEENGEGKRETSKHKQSSEILSSVPSAMSERLGEGQLLTDPSYPH